MAKGDQTREHILRRAATVFNRRGYAAASVADLERATGLRTGGLYRHFPGGKEALAVAAFRYAVARFDERIDAAAAADGRAVDRVRGLLDVYREHVMRPPVPGGCPVMNAAIEHDAGGSAALRAEARRAMGRWRGIVRDVIADGQRRGELRADVRPDVVATVVLSSMEGAVMIAGLYRDAAPVHHTADHLSAYLDTLTT